VTADRELKAMQATLAQLLPLKPNERQRVLDWLALKLGVASPAPAPGAAGGGVGAKGGGIKQFVKQKGPSDDVARVTTLGYFLTYGKNLATYGYDELSNGRIEAAIAKFNLSRALSNAQRAGYITTAGKHGTYQVTSFGESLVDAMPDAEAIKKVKAQGRRRRKPSTTKRTTTKKGTTTKK